MSADKFQQQVSHKMDELRLQPNPQVWVDVERRIREKKRRRVLVIWFLLGCLLIGGGTFWLLNQQGNKNETALVAVKKSNDKKTENNLPATENETNKTDNTVTIDEEKKTNPKNETNKQASATEENTKNEKEIISTKENKIKPERRLQTSHPSPSVVVKQKQESKPVKPTTKQKDLSAAVIAETKPNETKKEKEASVASNPVTEVTKQSQDVKTDNIITSVPSTKTTDEKSTDVKAETDSAAKNNVAVFEPIAESKKDADKKRANKSKWEWGINAALGNSRLTEGKFLDLNMNKSADLFSAPQGGNSNTPPPPVSYADSIPLNGPYWNVGISAKKQLGKKTSFSTGLNLAVYTTKQRVGAFVDSVYPINNDVRSLTYSGFYRPGQAKTFKNHYYFIQVPLIFNWQINKGEKLPPIAWENGFLPSFLISSNALSYDKQSRTFYKDKRLYTDVQLNYHTALTARLFKNSKHPLTAGVFYGFNMSLLQKVSPPNYNYLNSFGVKLNWVIKK